jgi:hypothetical protein
VLEHNGDGSSENRQTDGPKSLVYSIRQQITRSITALAE